MNEDITHQRIFESLPAYVLGALTSEERVEVEDHLDVCPACAAEYADLAEAGTILALNAPPREPPRGLKSRLMARIERDLQFPAELPMKRAGRITYIGRWGRWATRTRVRYAALGTAAAMIAAVAASLTVTLTSGGLGERVEALEGRVSIEATAVSEIAGNVMDRSEPVSADTDTTVETVSRLAQAAERLQEINRESVKLLEAAKAPTSRLAFLESADRFDTASGAIVAGHQDSTWGVLMVQGLRQPPPGYVYQLWIDSGDETRSVITFLPDAMGNFFLNLPVPFFSNTAVGGVTVEPFGGSQYPTGAEVLRLSAR